MFSDYFLIWGKIINNFLMIYLPTSLIQDGALLLLFASKVILSVYYLFQY